VYKISFHFQKSHNDVGK